MVATPRSQVLLLSKQEETSLSLGLRSSDVWLSRPLGGRRGAAQTFISKVHKKKIKCNSQENSSYTLHSFQTPLWLRRRQEDRFFSNNLNRKFQTCSTFLLWLIALKQNFVFCILFSSLDNPTPPLNMCDGVDVKGYQDSK